MRLAFRSRAKIWHTETAALTEFSPGGDAFRAKRPRQTVTMHRLVPNRRVREDH